MTLEICCASSVVSGMFSSWFFGGDFGKADVTALCFCRGGEVVMGIENSDSGEFKCIRETASVMEGVIRAQ